MKHKHIHMGYWIEELKGHGVHKSLDGKPLEELDYYDLRALVVKTHLQLDIEVKTSPWF